MNWRLDVGSGVRRFVCGVPDKEETAEGQAAHLADAEPEILVDRH
jgi:hypothetical protein